MFGMMVITNAGAALMDFAISGKTEHPDGDQPVQLSLF